MRRSNNHITSQSIARDRSEVIDQIIIRLLLVKYGIDKDEVRDEDIFTAISWIWDLRIEILSNRSSADPIDVIRIYLKDRNRVLKFGISITREFREKYNFLGNITPDEIEDLAFMILSAILRSRKSDMFIYINGSFKSEKSKPYMKTILSRK